MANFKHLGKDFIPHDVVAKVTGAAKYAEDFRVDGMVFCRLLTSPMPHARVKNIDASEALKMEGVLGMLTADDIPAGRRASRRRSPRSRMYVGEPILRWPRVSEQAAQDAIERIKIDYEPLPFTFDPLESLFPGGKDARSDGNIGTLAGLDRRQHQVDGGGLRAREDRVKNAHGQARRGVELRRRRGAVQTVQGGLRGTLRDRSLSHHSMEPRSCMAYWQNGKCFVHVSLQSQSFALPRLAQDDRHQAR